MDRHRNLTVRKLKRLLPSCTRLDFYLLVCCNAIVVLTLYSYIPGSPSNDPWNNMSLRFGKGHGLQGFVFCSAYRISTNEFVALGLSALALHSHMKVDACRWTRPDHSVVTGKLVASYPGDAHQKRYEIALLTCTLEEGVSSYRGGQLTMTIEQEDLPVYGEKPGSKNPTMPEPPYKSKLTFCSSPIYGDISEAHFVEWLEFHRVTHGVDYFHIYDAGGINPSLRARLKPYLTSRMMTITDVRAINQFETWLYAQLLAINDCAYRTRFTSEWALFMDIDEYLYVTKPPHSILDILDANQDAMWVTFGSKFFYTDKCTPSALASEDMPQPWSVEFLVYRQTEVHCKHVNKYGNRTHCLAFDGHRKYIINPRKIEVCGVNKCVGIPRGAAERRLSVFQFYDFVTRNSDQLWSSLHKEPYA